MDHMQYGNNENSEVLYYETILYKLTHQYNHLNKYLRSPYNKDMRAYSSKNHQSHDMARISKAHLKPTSRAVNYVGRAMTANQTSVNCNLTRQANITGTKRYEYRTVQKV